MTVAVLGLTTDEARQLTERIRVALDRVATSWADLGDRVAEAYERRADLALGYQTWEAYATAELRPSEGIAAEVRRELVGLLSARGMSPRAIAPVVELTDRRVRQIRAEVQSGSDFHPGERIDILTGEIVPAPSFTATDVTDWDPQEVADMLAEDEREIEAWKASTAPAPKTIGLDGKSYSRPEPKLIPAPVRDYARENAEQHCIALANALDVLWSLTVPEAFTRSFSDWQVGAAAARPSARERRNPTTLRAIATALTRYADHLEES